MTKPPTSPADGDGVGHDPAAPSSVFATALLAGFIAEGVRDLVLSPGSRSQALALAAAEFERAGLLRLRVRIDERSAGFLALGLAIESRRPVLIVTTSGSAVAHLHPVVLEASHSGVPLVVLSADRPEELHGIGANQTTTQVGIFGDAAPTVDIPAPESIPGLADRARDLARQTLAGLTGPAHVNLGFRDPLSSHVELPQVVPGEWFPTPPEVYSAAEIVPGPGTVVVAGAGAGDVAEEAARALGAPLLAEVSSGARYGPHLVAAYRELLRAVDFGGRVQRVVVFGHPTLSREVPELIQRPGVTTIVVRTAGREDYNPGHRVAQFVDALTVGEVPGDPGNTVTLRELRSWVGPWVAASRALVQGDDPIGAALTDDYAERAAFARDQLAELRAPVTRRLLAEAVWNASWPHDRLVLGASRLIRELDKVAPGKRIPVHANRGLAGIDGTIATATGIAIASQDAAAGSAGHPGVTRVLLGDLALLHDAGSLLMSTGEPRPRLQIIVGNDGGGTIFDLLEGGDTVGDDAEAAVRDRVMLTPQTVDLEALATAYGWEYRRVATRGDLVPALTPTDGRVLIEVPLQR